MSKREVEGGSARETEGEGGRLRGREGREGGIESKRTAATSITSTTSTTSTTPQHIHVCFCSSAFACVCA